MPKQETLSTALTLNNMRLLINHTRKTHLSQSEFIKYLPSVVHEIVFESIPLDMIRKKYRPRLSDLYKKNEFGKVSNKAYERIRQTLIDTDSQTFHRNTYLSFLKSLYNECHTIAWSEQTLSISDPLITLSPLDYLASMIESGDEVSDSENNYKTLFKSLYTKYMESPTKINLANCISYGILCSLFPSPNYLNGYLIPDLTDRDVAPKTKPKPFQAMAKHKAITDIAEILNSYSPCIVLGTYGSGKGSLIEQYLLQNNGKYVNVFRYTATSGKSIPTKDGDLSEKNLNKVIAQINTTIRHSDTLPALLVLKHWSGKKDIYYEKLTAVKNLKLILSTTNPNCVNLGKHTIIDLDHGYHDDYKELAKETFTTIYKKPLSQREKIHYEKLLKKVNYHFFSSIMLARSLNNAQQKPSTRLEQYASERRLYRQADLNPYMKSLGLESLSNHTFAFLFCACLMPQRGFTEPFFNHFVDAELGSSNNFEKAIEMGFLYKTSDKCYKLPPYLYHICLSSTAFRLNGRALSVFILKAAAIGESFMNQSETPKLNKQQLDYTELVYNILTVFTYRAGYFTSAFTVLAQYLAMNGDPPKAISFLKAMREEILSYKTKYLSHDLSIVEEVLKEFKE